MSAPEPTDTADSSTPPSSQLGAAPVVTTVGVGLLAGAMLGSALVLPDVPGSGEFSDQPFAAGDAAVVGAFVFLLVAAHAFSSAFGRLPIAHVVTPSARATREFCGLLTLFFPAVGFGAGAAILIRVIGSPGPAILFIMFFVGALAAGGLYVPGRAAQLAAGTPDAGTGPDS